jgi:PAS domain S-box-containing protein
VQEKWNTATLLLDRGGLFKDARDRPEGGAMVPNRERPRSDADPAGEVVLICDAAGHIVEASAPASTLTGYGPEELLSRLLSDLTPDLGDPDAGHCVPEIPAAAVLSVHTNLRRKDGSLRSCSLRMSRSSEGPTRRTVVRIRHRRRAAEVLPEDEGFNQVVLESSPHALLVLDEKGRVVFLNRAGEELLGRPFKGIRGQAYWSVLLPKEPAAAVAAAWKSGLPPLPASGEEEWLGPGGRRHRVSWSLRALPRPAGASTFVLLTGTDVTQVRELERRHASDSLLIESCGEAIFSKTLEGRILRWNSAAEQLYGYAASEIVGRSVATLVPPDRTEEWLKLGERLRSGESIRDFETTRIRKDGRRITVSLT